MSLSKRKRRQGSKHSQLVHRLETLEPRKLLTTLFGGETFWFIDAPNRDDARGQVVQISVSGDAVIELIGAATGVGTVTLGDLPGVIMTSDIGREGQVIGAGIPNVNGFGNDLFAIYVSQASAGSSIAISTVNITDQGTFLSPYTGVSGRNDQSQNTVQQTSGNAYDLHVNTMGGSPIISFSADIGGVYLGARLLITRPGSQQLERLRPVIDAELASTLGVRAVGIDEVANSPNNVSAGINVGPSLLEYYIDSGSLADRMVGENFDRVLGMAARRDIYDQFGIIMVDTDGVAADGLPTGLELGVVDPATGKITFTSVVEMLQAQLLGNTTITDPILVQGNLNVPGDSLFGIDIQSLASRADGATYGFNVLRVSVDGVPTKFVQLLQIDTATGAATVVAHLQSVIGDINGVTAADFDPISGRLYFIADEGQGVGKVTRLYHVDVNAGSPAAITASLVIVGAIGDDTTVVGSMAFDQTGPAAANLWVSGLVNGGELARIDATSGAFVAPGVAVTLLGNPINGQQLTGIAFVNPQDSAAETHVLAILNSGDASSALLRINLATGLVEGAMPTTDPADTTAPIRGQNLGGLTWNPVLANPFIGGLGVLVGIDTVSDSLMLLDAMPILTGATLGSSNLGSTTIHDPLIVEGNLPAVPDAGITIQALATRASDGATYGFNIVTVDIGGIPTELVQVVQIDTATGAATVVAHLQDPMLDVNNIDAAEFHPQSGLLYFIADKGAGGDRRTRLYSVNVDAGNAAQIAATVDAVGVVIGDDTTQVASMVFDQTGLDAVTLWVSGTIPLGLDTFDLARVDIATGAVIPGSGLNLTLLGNPVNGDLLTGLAFVNPDAAVAETHLYAVHNSGDENSALLRINLATGEVEGFALLADPTDLAAPVRGHSVGGLTWHPTLINPFTGQAGVLLGTDTASDELIYIDSRLTTQFATEIGRTPIADPINPLGTVSIVSDPVQDLNIDIHIQSLASWSVDGATYGFNVATVDVGGVPTQLVQFIEFDTSTGEGTVLAHLQGALGTINRVTAADFHPVTRRLFFVVDKGSGAGHQVLLYSLDPNAGGAVDIAATVALIGQIGDQSAQVESLAFDQFGPLPEDVHLWVSGTVNGGDLAQIHPLTAAFVSPGLSVTLPGNPVNGNQLTGLAFVNPDATATETYVYAVMNASGDGTALLRIDLSTGAAENLGLLAAQTTTDSATPVPGTHVHGLTWNPTLVSPFTGTPGVLLGVDTASDALVYIGFGQVAANALQTITYADVQFNDNEHLYGILNLGGVNWLGEFAFDADDNVFRFLKISDLSIFNENPINAMAVGLFSSTFDPSLGRLFVTDVTGALYELDYTASGGVITGVNTANRTLLGTMTDSDGRVLVDASITFDRHGRLLAHDKFNGRLVDVDWQTADGTTVVVGGQVATAAGSLRPTVGALALDWLNDQILAVDNAASWLDLGAVEGFAAESAFLMTLKGTSNATPTGQDIENILVGGRVTGRVNLSGSIDTFYAGSLLTGQTVGQGFGAPQIPGNFTVAGDLRNLVVSGTIGSNVGQVYISPLTGRYQTGFDMVVGGRVGQIQALGGFVGSTTVNNNSSVVGYPAGFLAQREVEQHLLYTGGNGDRLTEIDVFSLSNHYGLFASDGRFSNNTMATAQRLGTLRTGVAGQAEVINVAGTLGGSVFNDPIDYYAVSLLAGQTVTLRLGIEFVQGLVVLGVRDPDGRIIASTYKRTVTGFSAEADPVLRFTADRPGEYYFAVAYPGNRTFEAGNAQAYVQSYSFVLENAGDLALGGLVSGNYITSLSDMAAIRVARGDLGALVAPTAIALPSVSTANLVVTLGNLRTISAGSVGTTTSGQITQWPSISVPQGSVGLVQSTGGADAIFYLETIGAIGGDFQTLSSSGVMGGSFVANGGIGTIRVGGTFGLANEAPVIIVDADRNGGGIIDLIDVAGNLGTLSTGGPQITTGVGGNVRFIRVGGTIYQDLFYHTGDYAPLQLAEGVPYQHVDDGGAVITLTPGAVHNPNFDRSRREDPIANPRYLAVGALTITTYGIRSGGSVLVDVTSSEGGLSIGGNNLGLAGRAEISRITVNSAFGRPVVTNATGTGLELQPVQVARGAQAPDVNLMIGGPVPLDVLDIAAAAVNFTIISNTTGGQMIGMDVSSVGTLLSTASIGLAQSRLVSGMTTLPQGVVAGGNSYPFVDQRTAILAGDIVEIRAAQAVGNVIVTGSLGTVTANSDNVDVAGIFEGIAAPILVNGTLFHVNIGEGVAPSGSGAMSQAGLYAGAIGQVRSWGAGYNIWGDIVSNGGTLASGSSIGSIYLHGGSIVDALVAVYTELGMASLLYSGTRVLTGATGLFNGPLAIGHVTTNGAGGILGSWFEAFSLGHFAVHHGYGLVNSRIYSLGNGQVGNITVDGYGILGSFIQGGSGGLGNITATGRGQMLASTSFSDSVRRGEQVVLHPDFDFFLNPYNDLHKALATPFVEVVPIGPIDVGDKFRITAFDHAGRSVFVEVEARAGANTPADIAADLVSAWILKATQTGDAILNGITPSVSLANGRYTVRLTPKATSPYASANPLRIATSTTNKAGTPNQQQLLLERHGLQAGRIQDSTILTAGSAGNFSAYRIQGSEFNITNRIQSITVLASVDADPSTIIDSSFTTGSLGSFNPGGSLSGTTLNVAGRLGPVHIRGSVLDNSLIQATGENGSIDSIRVLGDLQGQILSANRIGPIFIQGDLTGILRADGRNLSTGNTLDSLEIRGDMTGSLQVNGNVGRISIARSLNALLPGDRLVIRGDLSSLSVGTANTPAIHVLDLPMIIEGNLGTLTVHGQLLGSLTVGRDLRTATIGVDANEAGGSLVSGQITVGNNLGALTINHGSLDAAIVVGRNIGTVNLRNGGMNVGSTLASLFGNIQSVMITAGAVNGEIRADNGRIATVTTSGAGADFGGTLAAQSTGTVTVAGNLLGTGMIDVTRDMASLMVRGHVLPGADIQAGSLRTLGVTGNLAGGLNIGTIGHSTFTLTVGGNWTPAPAPGSVQIDADASLTVRGNLGLVGTPAMISLGRSLTTLSVTGQAVMHLLVDRGIGNLTVGSLRDSVITSGFDMTSLTVNGLVQNSLIQAGISRGNDGVFAATLADKDGGETSRLANIGRLSVRGMSQSIVAAGGNLGNFTSNATVTDSSIHSGLSLGSLNIAAVLADATPLALVAERNNARQGGGSGSDLVLMRGDIANITLTGTGSAWTNTLITAGVDPGATGDFATPTVLSSTTGGSSRIGLISGLLGAGSRLITDAGIGTNRTIAGGGTLTQVDYDIADITAAKPLETLLATVTSTTPFTFTSATAGTVTIRLTGPGAVLIYDELGADTDDKIDTIRLSGTTTGSNVTITSSHPAKLVTLGRILADDNSTVGTFNFDGDLVGDGTADVDLAIDGAMTTLNIRNIGAAVVGRIGGDVGTARFNTLSAAAQLNVGGGIRSLTLAGSTGSALLGDLATYTQSFNTLSTDGIGTLWVHSAGKLFVANPAVSDDFANPPGAGGLTLVDSYNGSNFNANALLNMDFLGGQLYGLAKLYDPNPTAALATLPLATDLRGLAVNAAGEIFAVNTNNLTNKDQLVRINPTTGELTVVGTLRNPLTDAPGLLGYTQHVLATAFDNNGRLIALVSDRDGNGPTAGHAVTLVQIQTTDANNDGLVDVTRIGNPALQGIQLNGGAVTDAFKGLAVQAGTGTIYAIRDTGGLQDDLVTINPTTGAVTLVGTVQINGGGAGLTDIRGIGFDASGNLVAMDRDSGNSISRLIRLAAADLATPAQFQLVQQESSLADTLDVFAISKNGGFRTFAYDQTVQKLYGNPADAADAQGRAVVLGTIDTVTGQFSRVTALVDGNGVGLTAGADNRALVAGDNFNGGQLFVATGDGQLFRFVTATGVLTKVGDIREAGASLTLSALDLEDSTGKLVAIDPILRRVVEINPATGVVTARTGSGLVSENLSDLAFDTATGTFLGFVPGTNKFVSMGSGAAQGGLTASSIDTLSVNGTLGARITTTGNTFGHVTLNGAFSGALESAGSIRNLSITGNVSGSVNVGGDITTLTIRGDVANSAIFRAGGRLGSLTQTGSFDGQLLAGETGTLSVSQDIGPGAMIDVAGNVGGLTVQGDFAGRADLGWMAGAIHVRGTLLGGGRLLVQGDAPNITIIGGTQANSVLNVAGRGGTLNVGMNHRGTISVQQGLRSATFRHVTGGLLAVGMDLDNLTVQGDSLNAIYSVGTWTGQDGLYNTADDLITGGMLRSARFAGRFIDSVLAVGVLPSETLGAGAPADNRLYVGYSVNGHAIDSAEAGGLLPSRVDNVTFSGRIESSQPGGMRQSVLVSAGAIGRVSTNTTGAALAQRSYGDPAGAPTVLDYRLVSDSTIQVNFSEPLSSDSLRISNMPGDGGTITVTQEGQQVSNLTLRYTPYTDENGILRGRLYIDSPTVFSGLIQVTLDGTSARPIMDRSGMRSALRHPLVGDPLGTILDGNGDGVEGGNFVGVLFAGDAPNTFLAAAASLLPLTLDGGKVTLRNTILDPSDIDIFGFNGVAGAFLGVNLVSSAPLSFAVFHRDTQGTPNVDDDYFEVLARFEMQEFDGPSNLAQFLELPETGEYYLVVRGAPGILTSNHNGSAYTLNLSYASTDMAVANDLGGVLNLNGTVTISGQTHHVGYITPPLKQLVYLNFDGGTTTQYSGLGYGEFTFQRFDPGILIDQLAGEENRQKLIFGGPGVTGILTNILSIFNTLPANLPGLPVGGLAQMVTFPDFSDFIAATTGIWLTTIDPSTQGLVQGTDYTTVYVGASDVPMAGLLGLASGIDVAGRNPAEEAVVLVENFANMVAPTRTPVMLNRYSIALANVIAHELGHAIGLNHQPTTGFGGLLPDDPDNDPLTPNLSNAGQPALMAYVPSSVLTTQLLRLGTAPMTSAEFGIGHVDTAQLLVWWFA